MFVKKSEIILGKLNPVYIYCNMFFLFDSSFDNIRWSNVTNDASSIPFSDVLYVMIFFHFVWIVVFGCLVMRKLRLVHGCLQWMSTMRIIEHCVSQSVRHHLLLSGISPNVQVGVHLNCTNWCTNIHTRLPTVIYITHIDPQILQLVFVF